MAEKNNMTPMMVHYLETKKQIGDTILFYRLGDFYEMFFDDALTVSKELELTLTGKSCGLEERAPMCGVPYHAAETYVSKLVEKGYKVAICEQVEDPKLAKGMVRREIVKIVTPGTVTSTTTLDETKNNYIMCIIWDQESFGIATCDVTTGDFLMTEVASVREAEDEITKFNPSEIVINPAIVMSSINLEDLKDRLNISINYLEDRMFDASAAYKALTDHFHVKTLAGLGLDDLRNGAFSAGALLEYIDENLKTGLEHITGIRVYSNGKYMLIDSAARRNLELTETMREKNKRGSLLWVLDKTGTAMGARMLRNFILQPLVDVAEIRERQEFVKELKDNVITREEIREYLDAIYDLERLMGKVTYRSANPRDMLAFKRSLQMLPHIKFLLKDFKSELCIKLTDDIDPLEDIYGLIEASIDEDPPIQLKDGNIFKPGFNEEVDRLRNAKTDGKKWLAKLEEECKASTGIKNLRIKFNRVFGYFFEVTKSFLNMVPEDWQRKRTLANSECFTTPELKELEDVILNAEDRLYSLEYDLFAELRDKIASQVSRIQKTAKAIAAVDAYASLAYVAERNNYVCPHVSESGVIEIKGGRHPVIEKMSNELFMPNDTTLDKKNNRIAIITGPNMAGKSTYMRQTALIVLMAQIGSFVPADKADIGVCDRIFTRVGASDDLASGQSTFMVEMTEVANILRNATPNSLLILDEIGRGTSTYDGLSIAWAVIEHIVKNKKLGSKTLFATHYHELTELEGKLDGVVNYSIAVKEQGDTIVFLRKIVRGGADKSYGIQVARLAGVPEEVLNRAMQLNEELQEASVTENVEKTLMNTASTTVERPKKKEKPAEEDYTQLSMFDTGLLGTQYKQIVNRILEQDLTNMTPLDAMNLLYGLQNEIKTKKL